MLFGFSNAWAATNITFTWDLNTEQDIKGYRLYQSDIPFLPGVTPASSFKVGEDVLHPINTITISVEDGKWFWVATAFDLKGNESLPSNEVTELIDSVPPEAPKNFLMELLEKIVGWFRDFFTKACIMPMSLL